MNKLFKSLIFTFSILSFNNLNADISNLKNIYDFKFVSATNIVINDTNLIDEENAKNLLVNIKYLQQASEKQGNEIKEKNKNRKKPKYKSSAVDIFSEYSNSVVLIGSREKGEINGIGSGFIINKNGKKIVTNWHVIRDADQVHVWLKPNKMVDEDYLINNVTSYTAKIISVNKKKDLALLDVKGVPYKIKPIKYGKFENLKIGEELFAIGHPAGLLWSFTDGRVSQLRPDYKWRYKSSSHFATVIQTTTQINPGNSGGPLFNKKKELVGVNTFTAEGEGLNFAISVDDLVVFLNEDLKPYKKNKKSKYIKKKDKGSTWIKKKDKKENKGSIDFSNATEADINNNGVIDTWGIDENKNGIFEIVYSDFDENGLIELVAIDKNEDKNFEILVFDEDENGNPDLAEIDENEDGITDVIAYDYNQDGEWDKFKPVT